MPRQTQDEERRQYKEIKQPTEIGQHTETKQYPETRQCLVSTLILAAGAGTRYGMPKWQIEFHGKTFLEIIIEKVRKAGINNIVCVIREDSAPNIKGIKYAINPKPEQGMFSSLSIGIEPAHWDVSAHHDVSGYLIIPVDHPFFESATVKKLCETFNQNDCIKIIRPIFKGNVGHPIIIPKNLARKIPQGDYEGGLKKFINDSNVSVKNIEVDDPGILKNINTKENLQ